MLDARERVAQQDDGHEPRRCEHEGSRSAGTGRRPGSVNAIGRDPQEPDGEHRQDPWAGEHTGQRDDDGSRAAGKQRPGAEDDVVPELERERPKRPVRKRDHGQVPALLQEHEVDQHAKPGVVVWCERIQRRRGGSADLVEHDRQQQGRDDHRIKPAKAGEAVLPEIALLGVDHECDHEPRHDEEKQDRFVAPGDVGQDRVETRCGEMVQEDDECRGEPHRIQEERQLGLHR